ncbi:MAG: transglycosylase domain-containing protein, partial [Phycisphaeraceae bacterium]|nr:transglycosylase domain-containing protein [Phycisphaeraceae bacterium]
MVAAKMQSGQVLSMVTPSAQSDDPNTSSPDIEAGAASISFRRRLMRWFRRLVVVVAIFMVVGLAWLASLWHHHPPPIERLANWPTSPKIEDAEGRMLLERIGIDEQWRHPIGLDAMSPWLIQATLAVEDRRFHSHMGIDPAAVVRAAVQNATSGRVISGASTLSMQLCRMLDDKPRTLRSKIIESLQAVRIERAMTKDEILAAYLNIAPYGGNLRGVEAASRFWFSKPAADLALHEAALLAGLPQSPVRLNPARHPDRAVARRNLVLRRMHEEGMISAATLDEARSMPLELRIGRRNALTAPSMAWLALARRPDGGTIHLDRELQAQCQRLAEQAAAQLPADSDLAVVVIDIQRGQLAAMIGTVRPFDPRTGQVNSALGWRSPGSALKPFAYALAFEHRRLNAASTVDDRPMTLAGWRPENFDRTFSGQVTIAEALQRSLNLPAVRITEQMGLAGVVGMMEACGVQLFDDAARRGGLATVLGAVEVRLLDLTNAYATIGRGGLRRAPALFTDESDAPVRVLSEI